MKNKYTVVANEAYLNNPPCREHGRMVWKNNPDSFYSSFGRAIFNPIGNRPNHNPTEMDEIVELFRNVARRA